MAVDKGRGGMFESGAPKLVEAKSGTVIENVWVLVLQLDGTRLFGSRKRRWL